MSLAARIGRAGEKGSSAALRSDELAPTYCRSTPTLVHSRAPCIWTFLTGAAECTHQSATASFSASAFVFDM
jgi:hypothetical protein